MAQYLLKLPNPVKTVVFISSDSGSTTNFLDMEDGFAAYSASKAALNQALRVSHLGSCRRQIDTVHDTIALTKQLAHGGGAQAQTIEELHTRIAPRRGGNRHGEYRARLGSQRYDQSTGVSLGNVACDRKQNRGGQRDFLDMGKRAVSLVTFD